MLKRIGNFESKTQRLTKEKNIIMSKFDKQDWLEDRMELDRPPDLLFYEGEFEHLTWEEKNKMQEDFSDYYNKGAVQFRYDRGEITKELYDEIEGCKETGYPMEAELWCEDRKQKFEIILSNTPKEDIEETINDEIAAIKEIIHSDKPELDKNHPISIHEINNIKRGIVKPLYKNFKGSEYAEIKHNYDLMKAGKAFKVTSYFFYDFSHRRGAWLFFKYYLKNPAALDTKKIHIIENSEKKNIESFNDGYKTPYLIMKDEIRQKLYDDLKHYFTGQEGLFFDLMVANKPINEKLQFHGQQNVFVELFQRLDYNGFLSNTKDEVNNWITTNFTYKKRCSTGGYKQADFKKSSVRNILKGDTDSKKVTPPKNNRLCDSWAKFIPYRQLSREKQEEA